MDQSTSWRKNKLNQRILVWTRDHRIDSDRDAIFIDLGYTLQEIQTDGNSKGTAYVDAIYQELNSVLLDQWDFGCQVLYWARNQFLMVNIIWASHSACFTYCYAVVLFLQNQKNSFFSKKARVHIALRTLICRPLC